MIQDSCTVNPTVPPVSYLSPICNHLEHDMLHFKRKKDEFQNQCESAGQKFVWCNQPMQAALLFQKDVILKLEGVMKVVSAQYQFSYSNIGELLSQRGS